jgi:hypothetical protein
MLGTALGQVEQPAGPVLLASAWISQWRTR